MRILRLHVGHLNGSMMSTSSHVSAVRHSGQHIGSTSEVFAGLISASHHCASQIGALAILGICLQEFLTPVAPPFRVVLCTTRLKPRATGFTFLSRTCFC